MEEIVRRYLRVFVTRRVSVYFRQHLRHDTTGEQVSMTGLKLYRLRDGRIVQMWGETDLYGLLRQLGKVPAEIVF